MAPSENIWQYSTIHNSACKVIEQQTLWGQTVCRIWLPNQDAVVRVPRSALRPLSADLRPEIEAGRIAYVAAAAKVAEVLEGSTSATEGHVLLAPMESNVIPLPHQIHALSRAISGDRVRYLLADEVGLGKTIEAGLIMRELKLRGLVRRILVVAPKGLATQWVAEMQTHFNEQFQLVLGDDINTLQRLAPQFDKNADHRSSAWTMFDQVIVSLDSVKPMDKRRGWTAERVAEYNRSRFEDLITAGWDLVVVDEAHRLGGSTDQVARYKLGKGLAEAAPYVLLLSATPHQGKTDAFHRLMNLLDDDAFPDMESVTRDRVAPYVIRTEKRKAIDAEGKPLFKPRRTQMAPVAWESRHHLQQLLYEAVTDYVREGYNQALREKKRHIGFQVILVQLVNLLRGGQPVAMSTRSGEFVTLEEVVAEVGRDAARFIFLTRAYDSPLDFDLEVAKQRTNDNPVYYVQYVHARIASILRKAQENGMAGLQWSAEVGRRLAEAEEIALIKALDQYPRVVETAAENLAPHRVTFFLMQLAALFHAYYNKHRVLVEDPQLAAGRLGLILAVQKVIRNGLALLGVSAPEQM